MSAPVVPAATGAPGAPRASDLATVSHRPAWSGQLSGIERAGLLVGVTVLAALATGTLVPAGRDLLGLTTEPDGLLLAAAAVYALGHLLRGLRLVVLLNDPLVGARRILAAHVLTSGLGLLLPFKLGDLVRMRVTGVLVGSTVRGVVATVLERCLDVGVILAITIVAATTADELVGLLTPLLVLSGVFVLATVAAVTVVPGYLRALSLYLVRRPRQPPGVRLLSVLARTIDVLDEAPRLLLRRTPTLVALTGLVWCAELAALRLAVPVLGDDLVRLSGALASFLASLSSGAVALLPSTLREGLATAPLLDVLGQLQLERYRSVLVIPLLWASVGAGLALRAGLLSPVTRLRRHTAW